MCLPYVDVLLGIEPYHLWKDENDHSKGDWKDGVPMQPSYEQQDEIFQRFIERYPLSFPPYHCNHGMCSGVQRR